MSTIRLVAASLVAASVLTFVACSGTGSAPQYGQSGDPSADPSNPGGSGFVGGAADCPRLAGSWAGPVTLTSTKTEDGGFPMEQTHQISEFPPFDFDAQGRLLFDFEAGKKSAITHVGQTYKVLHGKGHSTYTVREVSYAADGCRYVIDLASDRYTSQTAPGGTISDTVQNQATTVLTFQFQGEGLRVEFKNNATTTTNISTPQGNSTSRSSSALTLSGVLTRR